MLWKSSKVEKILKRSLDSVPSPSPSVKIQIMKICLRCRGKTLLGKLLKQWFCWHHPATTSPSTVLPFYLEKMIWIFTDGEGWEQIQALFLNLFYFKRRKSSNRTLFRILRLCVDDFYSISRILTSLIIVRQYKGYQVSPRKIIFFKSSILYWGSNGWTTAGQQLDNDWTTAGQRLDNSWKTAGRFQAFTAWAWYDANVSS